MNRLLDLNHVLDRARVHGIKATRLEAKTPTVSLHPCPACRDGHDALCEYDGFGVIPLCRGCEDGAAIAAALLADPAKPPAPPDSTFPLYTPAQLLEMLAPVWLVEPLLREACITELFGAFGVYKSFTAAAWAAEAPGLAVYVSAEGSPHDLGAVFSAWETAAERAAHVLCLPRP